MYGSPSVLELQLKALIRRHPDAVVHPHSPSGPYSRTVMWDADENRWTVRAVDLNEGDEGLVVQHHPDDMDGIAPAITRAIDTVRDPLSALPPGVAETLRSLRDGA